MKTTKAVIVTFENYYCRMQNQTVIGTSSVKKAIKAVNENQGNRKCEIKSTIILKSCDTEYDIFNCIIV